MKKIGLLLVIGLIPMLLMGAAPTFQSYYHQVGDVVIDSQHTGNWEPVGTLIVTASDSAYATLSVTTTANLMPWERLYLGFGNDSANRVSAATAATTGQTNSNLDTNLVKLHPSVDGDVNLPLVWQYVVSMNASQVDTFYLNIATGGSNEKIELYDLVFSAQISDRD